MNKARMITEKARGRVSSPLTYKDLLDMLEDSESNIREALLDYYRSEKGKQDIASSPHLGKTPEAIVESLMEEIRELKGRRKRERL